MNKNFRVIKIKGLSGFLLTLLLITGLFGGFILFPIWIIMQTWNFIIVNNFHLSSINFYQATLLFGIIITIGYILLKDTVSVKIQKEEQFKTPEIKELIKEIKEKEEL